MIAGLRPVDAGRAIDQGPWGGYQRWLVFLTALTIVFDGIDNQLLGVTIPSIMADWHVPRSAFAPIVALGYLGMMIGGAVAGLAGDRFGRRSALLVCMVIFGGATLAVSTAGSVGALATLRLVAGIGLGGAMPNAAALAAEFVPVARRALAVTLTIVCVPLGATLAGLIAIPALPAFGWRALFVLGGVVPIVAALVLFWLLPESPRYLAGRPERWEELKRLLRRMGHPVEADATFHSETGPEEQRQTRAPLATILEPALQARQPRVVGGVLLVPAVGLHGVQLAPNDTDECRPGFIGCEQRHHIVQPGWSGWRRRRRLSDRAFRITPDNAHDHGPGDRRRHRAEPDVDHVADIR